MARQLDEQTYAYIRDTLLDVLRVRFALLFRVDKVLREGITKDYDYGYNNDRKEWTDTN